MKFTLISENIELFSSNRLLSEAQSYGLESTHIAPYSQSMELSTNIHKPISEIIFHRTTGIRFDEFDFNYSYLKQIRGATIVNNLSSLSFLRDKEQQLLKLIELNLPTVPSYSFRGRPSSKLIRDIINFFTTSLLVEQKKFIIKTVRGNQGIGVMLANGTDSLLSILEAFWGMKDQKFIIQPYLDATEYRYFISNNKILAIIKKEKTNDFRGNSDRNNGEIVDQNAMPRSINQLALDTMSKCNLLYAGIDILIVKEKTYILEVNPVPGFQQAEQLTGENIAKTLIKHSVELHNDKQKLFS